MHAWVSSALGMHQPSQCPERACPPLRCLTSISDSGSPKTPGASGAQQSSAAQPGCPSPHAPQSLRKHASPTARTAGSVDGDPTSATCPPACFPVALPSANKTVSNDRIRSARLRFEGTHTKIVRSNCEDPGALREREREGARCPPAPLLARQPARRPAQESTTMW